MELTNPSQIRALLERHGFHFSKSMGQNFLIASWVPERMAEVCELDGETGVLEVGPGVGCLTARLAQAAGKVVAIELDKSLKPVLQETLAGCDNVEIVFGDAMKQDLCKLISDRMKGRRPVVCANLPYNMTSPLLAKFIDTQCFDCITVMVQREAAQRICAKAGTSEYGMFTVYVNWNCETELLFNVSPDCFMPRPKVVSSVIRLRPRKAPPAQVTDEQLMFRVVKAAFGQRRKMLCNALSKGLPDFPKDRISAAIESCGLDPRIRGESLDFSAFAELANHLVQ